MKKLDSKIVKIQKIMGVRNLITEASKKDVLINKLGVSETIAQYMDEKCGGLSVIMFKKIINYLREVFLKQRDEALSEKDVIQYLNSREELGYSEKQYLQSIMDWVRVGLNGRLNQYQDLSFVELYKKSKEWHDSLELGQGDINYEEKNDIIKDFRDENGYGFYWVDLNTNSSDEECERMGHCGRTGYGNTLYSLREQKPLPGGKYTLNKSHLTASIGRDGILYQLKGPKNSKPKEEFHSYILPLFFVLGGPGEEEDYLIQGFGSEYASNLDFKITDLPDDTIKQLYTERPDLFKSRSLQRKLSDLGLIETKDFPSFTLSISPDNIDRYVDGDWKLSTRRWVDKDGNKRENTVWFFESLLTDPWDLYDNWDADISSSLDYYINKENEKKIRTYLLGLSDNPSEFEELSTYNLIYEFDDDGQVSSAIASATSDAEADDYINALQDHMKDLLSEYGEVLKLNSDGAEIVIDLQDFIDEHVDNDEWFDGVLENCGEEDSECIFGEIIDDYGFSKPKWNFDDRYYPHVDKRYFNEILSDRLSEFI